MATNPKDTYWNIRLKAVKKALEENNFDVYLCDDTAEANELVKETILPELKPSSISWGGSLTFSDSGLYSTLKDHPDIDVLDTFDKSIPFDEMLERRRKSLLSSTRQPETDPMSWVPRSLVMTAPKASSASSAIWGDR